LTGSDHANKVASGPKTAPSHIHALIDRSRVPAMRPAIDIDIDIETNPIAVMMPGVRPGLP
jgi:hypothetical protein